MLKSLPLLFSLSALVSSALLPSYFTICSKNDKFKECVLDNIAKNWQNIARKGDESIHLPNLNPMKITKMNLQASPSLRVDLNNLEYRGFDTCIGEDINMDLATEDFSSQFVCQYVEMIATYNLYGKILFLPIQGNGNLNMTIIKPRIDIKAKLEILEKEGEKYYNIVPIKVIDEPERIYYKIENLFNGDPRLGEEMNKFLNENWKEVFQEIGPGVSTTATFIVKTIINAFFNNIPVKDLHH